MNDNLLSNRIIHRVADENSLECYKEFIDNFPASDSEKRVTIDQSFRDVLRDLTSANSGCEVYRKFICLTIDAVTSDLCTPVIPFMCLTDIFDVIPIDQCEDMFGLVEDKVHVWKSQIFYDTGKNFLLRMCNDLLRRLSKSQNTVFCGRIQLFLSRLFPLAEKSALNLMSQFNLENVTLYNQAKPEHEAAKDGEKKSEQSMETEDGEMEEQKTEVPIDYNLYRKFWSLQDYFRKPGQCYEKKLWTTFMSNSDAVFEAFASSKLDDMKSSKKKVDQRRNLEPDAFFAKYLTSEKLLNLQLNDSNFRRYVLMQFLIIFQYLGTPVKFKGQAHTLSDEQSNWIKSSTEKIYQLIKETPPDGEKFAKTVEHILEREEHWNRWKNDGCPDFERKPADDTKKQQRRAKRRRIGDDLQASGGKVIKMGHPELTRLWNLNPNNMDACKSDDRIFLPTLEEFFQEAIEQNDPEAQIEEEYKLTNDQTFQWKALRLLARRSPQFFTNSATPAQDLKSYLNGMLSKIAKQLPNQQGEEMKTDVEDEEGIKETQDDEDMKNTEQGKEEIESKEIVLNKHIIRCVAEKIGKDWKKVAVELSFPEDDIAYFESEDLTDPDRGAKILTIWMEEDPDRHTAAALRVALTEVGLQHVADSLNGPS
ncbi:THO complex subunit 1-like isoform X2 [Mercenaria mercenaria]|uniref:THO complex subunit 1-like isoform X2 n=1 Tax=Mercenaria mercenaria TaxID=6596 RepID=UPI00234E57C0|nr:THO complex subunit 1-like isoform X2 [Mercenaria mercenaria]